MVTYSTLGVRAALRQLAKVVVDAAAVDVKPPLWAPPPPKLRAAEGTDGEGVLGEPSSVHGRRTAHRNVTAGIRAVAELAIEVATPAVGCTACRHTASMEAACNDWLEIQATCDRHRELRGVW